MVARRTAAIAVPAMLALLLATGSCGDEPTEASPAMCPDTLKFQGVEYQARGSAEPVSTDLGKAVRGECSDVSGDTGVSFPSDGENVAVGSLEGVKPEHALGAVGDDGEFYFYVASNLPADDADEISRRLGQ